MRRLGYRLGQGDVVSCQACAAVALHISRQRDAAIAAVDALLKVLAHCVDEHRNDCDIREEIRPGPHPGCSCGALQAQRHAEFLLALMRSDS